MNGGWDRADVAQAQRELVDRQLENPRHVAPFAAFLRVMELIPRQPHWTFLDIGCGVGHYGRLLSKYYPDLCYIGVDNSRAMIAEARRFCPTGHFLTQDVLHVASERCDIAMAAQCLEYLEDPKQGLAYLVEHLPRWLILHRLRLTLGLSHRIESESTYCGNSGPNYLWNLNELLDCIGSLGGTVEQVERWEQHATIVVQGRA